MLRQSGAQTAGPGDLYLLGTVDCGRLRLHAVGTAEPDAARLGSDLAGRWRCFCRCRSRGLALWPHSLANIPASAWAGLLYVSFISQFFAFFVFNAAMAIGGVSRVGQLMLLQPFVIVALAAPVNGEPIQLVTLAYAAAVVATVAIGQRMRVTRG